tara:strand:- start:2545 stop:2652 length:108 start_codon:yes stop_codon:yes gene_type:complete
VDVEKLVHVKDALKEELKRNNQRFLSNKIINLLNY